MTGLDDLVGGGDADELAEIFGIRLDAAGRQQLADGLRFRDSDPGWARLEVTAVPDAVLARAMAGLFLLGERVMVLSDDRHGHFRQVADLIDASEMLRARVRRTSALNGWERVELIDGARMWFISLSSVRRARGTSADLVTVYGGLGEEQRAAVMPCLAGRPNPQIWYAV